MLFDSCKSNSMIAFLEAIRQENPDKPICITLNNARIQHAKIVKTRAKELNIHFIHLSPHSPNLNPIEFSWKYLKRKLNSILDFNKIIKTSEKIAIKLFNERKTVIQDTGQRNLLVQKIRRMTIYARELVC